MNPTRRSRRLGIFEARALHDDRCLRQLFNPCQVTEEIADSGTTAVQNGPLVLATQTGLVRFDRVQFQQFAPVTVAGVPASILEAALVDRRWRLWVAKEGGTLVSAWTRGGRRC
jgi:hypothetical protein